MLCKINFNQGAIKPCFRSKPEEDSGIIKALAESRVGELYPEDDEDGAGRQ